MKPVFWKYIFLIPLTAVLAAVIVLRVHTVRTYNTYWSDDGGSHLKYVEILANEWRLPTMGETIVAWHEPGGYAVYSLWFVVYGFLAGSAASLNALEAVSAVISIAWFWAVLGVTYEIVKNKWVALANATLFSILVPAVKLSASVNPELLAQTMMLGAVWVGLKWKLFEKVLGFRFQVLGWALILGVAMLVKITVAIIVIAAVLAWIIQAILNKSWRPLAYAIATIAIVGAINAPWFAYEAAQYGSALSINEYEQNKQPALSSPGWEFFKTWNWQPFADQPYWGGGKSSFWSMVIADAFGDHYNLFTNVDRLNSLQEEETFLIANGRRTTPRLLSAMIDVNRVGLALLALWIIGIFVRCQMSVVRRQVSGIRGLSEELFIYFLVIGGILALSYNVLRLPYLERGTLKAQFVLYMFPLVAALGYAGLRNIKNNWVYAAVVVVPVAVYVLAAWPVLWIR